MEMNRILNLISASHYIAANAMITPATIPQSEEWIEIITGGIVFFELDGEIREFGPGTIFWHIAGEKTIHLTADDNPYRCLAIRFKVAKTQRILPRVTKWKDLHAFSEFHQETLRHAHDERTDRNILANVIYAKVFWEAYLSTRRQETENYPLPLSRSIKIIERNYSEQLSIAELAERANTSESYLYSLFRQHLNSSPHQYLLLCRLRHTRTMLADNKSSIKEIAAICGFENIESFYRAFRKNSRMTPFEYRKLHSPKNV